MQINRFQTEFIHFSLLMPEIIQFCTQHNGIIKSERVVFGALNANTTQTHVRSHLISLIIPLMLCRLRVKVIAMAHERSLILFTIYMKINNFDRDFFFLLYFVSFLCDM